ncbi:hypothetical protein IMZ48_15275 [Candidatus Bathyarchaeota archaeon]|nr:hypothetical protein [Candidatus Bathyarchaeota archaeon]
MCKFEGLDDPNYHIVRDSLSAAMDTLLNRPLSDENTTDKAQLAILQSYLGMKEKTEDNHHRVEGSCQWIENREDFQHWISDRDTNPSFYVMTAQPGAGKTVLAAHVVSRLKERNLSCAYHFIQSGNDQEQSLAGILRSIAYQMASTTAVFRNALLRLHEDGSTFAMDDARTIWVKIFKKGLFQVSRPSPCHSAGLRCNQ